MSSDDFYDPKYPAPAPAPNKRTRKNIVYAAAVIDYTIGVGCEKLIHTNPDDPCATHYPASSTDNKKSRTEFEAMMSPLTPDDYFEDKYGKKLGDIIQARGKRLRAELKSGAMSIAHRTPLTAGGCPVGEGNLQPVSRDCLECEKELSEVQGALCVYHRKVHSI